MTIYEIDTAISSLVNDETGEIKDFAEFEALQMEKETKIENIALWYKNLIAESKAIKEEEKALSQRRKVCENKAENLKQYLDNILQGDKFKTSRVIVSYRKSTAIEIDDEFIAWAIENNADMITQKAPEANKTVIKEAITSGIDVPHAQLVERNNIGIK